MRVAYVSRTEALPALKSVAPEDLLLEIIERGVTTMPPLNLLNKTTECPHCGIRGKVAKDFGVRVLGGTVRAQSWCRECRKNPKRMAKNGSKPAPENEREMVEILRASLLKAGVKRSQLAKLAKAMSGVRS